MKQPAQAPGRPGRGARSRWRWLLLTAAVALFGCPAMRTVTSQSDGRAAAAADSGLAVSVGMTRSATGCAIEHSLYRGGNAQGPVEVVLGHGFLRSRERMHRLAANLARAGIPTLTLDFCNMQPWRGAHRENADDMVRLATRFGADQVVYAGFSAGGLAAVLAAAQDPRAAGVFVLDLVDRDRMGERAAVDLRVPLRALYGEPSACNAQGNGRAVLAAAPRARGERIVGATHCDFEAPTDRFCRLVCEPDDRPVADADALREVILTRATRSIQALVDGRSAKRPAAVERPRDP